MGASTSWPAGACLVTGCAGFVGGHLTEALLALGAEVAGVDDFSTGRRENMEGFANHPKFHFLERDILEPDWLGEVSQNLSNVMHVFHLAAVVSVAYSMDHETETLETNYKASIELYNQAVKNGVRSFVFAGSAAEYGDEYRLPIKEEYAQNRTIQLSPYGRSKYLASRHIVGAEFGCSLRCFNIYGPRQDPSSPYSGVISRFLLQATHQEPLTILGAGDQTRDFIYVADVVRAYLLAAGLGPAAGDPLVGAFNVGSGRRLSIQELAKTVNKITGNPAGLTHLPPRPGDVLHSLADVSKLEQATGFKAETMLETGLEATWRAANPSDSDLTGSKGF
jgi:UDP-glucose 4-epimerase